MLQTSSTVNGGSWWFKMAGLSEAEKIALLEPELQSLLDARKVGASVQAALHDAGVDGLNMLAAIATSRDELKAFARDSLAIDGSTRAEDVVRFATLFLAWQSSCSRVKIQDELNSELAAQKQPKAIPPMEMQSWRMQFEKAYIYRMKDAEIPARASFEDLCEQLDSGELRAMSLRHFGSKADDEDVEAGTLQLGKAGQVKIRRSRIETAAPTDMEGLRSKITLMANHFLFAKFRYTNKAVLGGLTPFSFLDYVGYLTGKHVASLESQTIDGVSLHRPSIKMVVHYDHQMRKEVVEKMNAGAAMVDCLKEVVKDSDLRERHFSTPLAVSSATQSLEKSGKEKGWDRDRWHPYPPPKGKGKGKEKGKGSTKQNTKVTSFIQQPLTDVNYALLGTTRPRGAREIAIVFMLAVSACRRTTLRSTTPKTRRPQQGVRAALRILDQRRRCRCTGFSTCSAAGQGAPMWHQFLGAGQCMENLQWRWMNGTSQMMHPQRGEQVFGSEQAQEWLLHGSADVTPMWYLEQGTLG